MSVLGVASGWGRAVSLSEGELSEIYGELLKTIGVLFIESRSLYIAAPIERAWHGGTWIFEKFPEVVSVGFMNGLIDDFECFMVKHILELVCDCFNTFFGLFMFLDDFDGFAVFVLL